ncbi:UDP-glucuronosyltransferase 2C1-like [Protopterus annectens]|uniref:UDP-glucuronosyltransferase 2C1-like n=1 Tax=Protopterus annectens TaxID=7888 RepID=UPI001CFBA245|nr:UDP-glucuronosyltransferase 2C1-like [Protopterus annectens]
MDKMALRFVKNVRVCSLLMVVMVTLSKDKSASAAKILVVPEEGSHWLNIKILFMELIGRGHEVTVLRKSNAIYIEESYEDFAVETVQMPRIESLSKEFVEKQAMEYIFSFAFAREMKPFGAFWHLFSGIRYATMSQSLALKHLFEDQSLLERLRTKGFQLVLADPYYAAGVMLAKYLNLPVVFFGRWMPTEDIHFAIAPNPLSYVPVLNSRLTDKMTFSDRLTNVFLYNVGRILSKFWAYAAYDELCRIYLKTDESLYDLYKKADIYLMKVDFTFEFPRPVMPNAVYIGGFQCRPPSPLPLELQEFMDSSGEDGVVLFSLGTLVKTLPYNVAEQVASGLAQLPQKVIWRYIGDVPSTLGNNTKLMSWFPQNDLLSHPKTKAFISHGGENGVYEAIYHGVPIIGFPLFGDQYENILRLKARGAAFLLDNLPSLSGEDIYRAVKTVIEDPSYRESMQYLSALHRDVLVLPNELAVFWIEFVIRHKGAAHLQAAGNELPFYVYHCLDILVFLFTAVALLFFILVLMLKLIIRKIFLKTKKKKD